MIFQSIIEGVFMTPRLTKPYLDVVVMHQWKVDIFAALLSAVLLFTDVETFLALLKFKGKIIENTQFVSATWLSRPTPSQLS